VAKLENKSEIQSRPGRRPANQSRAAELRAGLAAWMRIPENKRISLRGLAKQLGTSHQLLNSYLRSWDRWQMKEYEREAKEIRASADAEGRAMTPGEEQRVRVCTSQASRWMFSALLNDEYRKLWRQARRGKLTAGEVKMLTYFGRRGDHQAQAILAGYAPKSAKVTASRLLTKANLRAPVAQLCDRDEAILDKLKWVTDSDEALRLMNQLTSKGKAAFKAAQEERRKRTGNVDMA
jgi:hypothetical protein